MKHVYALVLLLFAVATVEAQTIDLNETGFIQTRELQMQERSSDSDFKSVKRMRPFYLNPQIKNHQNIRSGQQITLTLFDDVIYTATVLVKTTDINAVTTLTLKLNSLKYAYAYIAISADSYLVTVDLPEQNQKYSSRTSIQSEHSYMVQLDEAEFQNAGCGVDTITSETGIGNGVIPQMPEGMNRMPNSSNENLNIDGSCSTIPDISEPATIRIMIVYTTEAQNWSDTNNGGIANSIAVTMALANQVSVNNNLGITFELAYSGFVNYTQVSIGTDWVNLLTDGDGILDEVNQLRQDNNADLVSILNYYGSGGAAGIANLLTSKYGNNRAVFSAVRVNFAVNTITFIHEIGHNLGAMHNPYQNSDPGPTGWENWPENTYSAGWRWQGSDGNYYSDLMSYPSGSEYADGQFTTSIPYFSDPNHTHLGGIAGDPVLGDNARTLREIKHFVARYKETIDYCNAGNAPLYNQTALYIDNVSMGVIGNASGASSARYGDFTALATCMIPGDTQTLDISVVNSNNGRPVKVWIDWNSNTIFDPETELIYDSVTGSANHSVNITAPLGVSYGTKRMRIRTYSSTTAPVVDGPCGYSGVGEVEDYTIILEAPVPCAQADTPQNLIAGTTTNSTAYLSWDAVEGIDQYELRYREIGATEWQNVSPIWYHYHTITDLILETDYEAQVRSVCNGTQGSYTSSTNFSTIGYCESSGGSTINILNVTFADINQSSPGGATQSAYTDFTNVLTDVEQGITYQMSINAPGPDGIAKNFRVWIDYNLNGSFEDAGELVLDIPNMPLATVEGNITVHQGTLLGTTRMRVSVKMQGAVQEPCDSFNYGEVEDYTLNILPFVSCEGATVPENLSVENISHNQATLTWDEVPGASYDLRYRETGASEWIELFDLNENIIILQPLNADTEYEVAVRSVCDQVTLSNYTTPLIFTTFVTPLNYCDAGATNTSYEKISNVTFNGINNNSTSTAGYEDFINISTVVEKGESYAFSASFTGQSYPSDQVLVWIDFNQNGDLSDPGEQVLVTTTSTSPWQGTIVIPNDALTGTTRMRIRLHDSSLTPNVTPCGNSSYGQVEDYTIVIDETLNVTTPTFGDGFTLYPNPMTDVFYISTQNIQDDEVDITVRTLLGQMVFSKSMRVPFDGVVAVELEGLATGQYLVELLHPEGGKFISKLLKK